MEHTEQEIIENSQEFKRRLGAAFSSMPDRMPGAVLVGKYFTMSGESVRDDASIKKLSQEMVKDMGQHTKEEIADAMFFINETVKALEMLHMAFLLELVDRRQPKEKLN